MVRVKWTGMKQRKNQEWVAICVIKHNRELNMDEELCWLSYIYYLFRSHSKPVTQEVDKKELTTNLQK